MATLKLKVPLEAQEKANCCWHTAAYMIWLYWQGQTKRQGPMNTVAPSYEIADTVPLPYSGWITLAKKFGLVQLPVKNQHTEADLHGYLRDHGPVWSAGLWFGVGHAIVLTGIDGSTVYFNDPDGGVAKKGTAKWFNEKLYTQWIGCLMVKDSKAY